MEKIISTQVLQPLGEHGATKSEEPKENGSDGEAHCLCRRSVRCKKKALFATQKRKKGKKKEGRMMEEEEPRAEEEKVKSTKSSYRIVHRPFLNALP